MMGCSKARKRATEKQKDTHNRRYREIGPVATAHWLYTITCDFERTKSLAKLSSFQKIAESLSRAC